MVATLFRAAPAAGVGMVAKMKDISKCSGEGCPVKDTCRRFTVQSDNLWQSNIAPAYKTEGETCWNYLQDTKSVNKRIAAQRGEE